MDHRRSASSSRLSPGKPHPTAGPVGISEDAGGDDLAKGLEHALQLLLIHWYWQVGDVEVGGVLLLLLRGEKGAGKRWSLLASKYPAAFSLPLIRFYQFGLVEWWIWRFLILKVSFIQSLKPISPARRVAWVCRSQVGVTLCAWTHWQFFFYRDKQPFALFHKQSWVANLCMSWHCGRKLEYMERTHAGTWRTCKLHTERAAGPGDR